MSQQRIPRPQWPLLTVLFLGVVAIALGFILANPLTSSPEEQRQQRYVEAIVGSPARVNPLFAPLNDTDADLASLVFSGLTRLGLDGQVLPDLAQSWEVSPDGLNYTFKLRRDVNWHTGAAFTAEDALFTYELLADPDLPSDSRLGQLWRQVSCNAPDEFTLICELSAPFAPFLSFTSIGLLPKHILEGTSAATIQDSPFNQAPAGTGPFRLAQLDQSKAILRANPTYYGERPAIDEIEFRFFPNPSTAAAALSRGEVQGLLLGPSASQEDFDLLTSSQGLRAYTSNRTLILMLFLNNSQPPFDDKALREAVALSVNVDDLISDLLGGRAVRADSPIVPGTWAYNPQLEPRPHDLEAARELLDEAGWEMTDDGVRQKDGKEMRISLMTDQDPLRIAIAQMVANQLAEVGIQVAVTPQDADLRREFLAPHQYQAAIFGWDPGPDPDPYLVWHSSQVEPPDNGNIAGYQNEDADRVIEEARQTTDLDKRQALYYTFQQMFFEDVPSVLLYYPAFTYFVAEEVQNIELGTLFRSSSRFANATQWSTGESPELLDD
ncbi:MAG: peptide ABC transporter substrate-binding protein [Chloroflexi bacterium]|nr:peptide ABC transporter substrate-binding protein [Chloroflexota bacterium]